MLPAGRPGPVRARVTWGSLAAAMVTDAEVPGRLFVGRERELEELSSGARRGCSTRSGPALPAHGGRASARRDYR